jgi:hypothetical protein
MKIDTAGNSDSCKISQLPGVSSCGSISAMRTPLSPIATIILLSAILQPVTCAADKLKGFYSGSGGLSQEVHRVLILEFAADGTAILQQKWHDKDAQTWHAHWKKDGKTVTLTFDPAKDAPVPQPLVFTFKHDTLTPTSWDTTTLGPLGPPKLTPFGGKNIQVGTVSNCQSLNTNDPSRDCVTWGSNR